MQLNDILEENSIKAISAKTKIPEDQLEALFANQFENLKRVKTLGFISILEREFGAELEPLRAAAKSYYDEFQEEHRMTLDIPEEIEKKGKSKFLFLAVFVLLAYASWYFFTQFDQKNFAGLLEFIDQSDSTVSEKKTDVNVIPVKDLSIVAVTKTKVSYEDNTSDDENVTKENDN